MCRKAILALTAACAFAGSAYAMPPHPDLVEKFRNEGTLDVLKVRMSAMRAASKDSPSRASLIPSTGALYIPVVLVAFNAPYQEAAFTGPVVNMPDGGAYARNALALSAFFALFLIAAYASGSGKKYSAALACVFAVPVLLFCGSNSSGDDDDGYFATDVSVYRTLLNGASSSDLSVRKYYQDMSNNRMTISFDFFGPVTVPEEWSYYGENDSYGDDAHVGQLVYEALNRVIRSYGETDFSRYDNNGDGCVDTVIVVHQGRGEESGADSSTIWSCQWDLASAAYYGDGRGPVSTGDGVYFNTFTIQPEYIYAPGDTTNGVFCHELGHVFGLEDSYDTSNATNGVGDWSLMSSGSWGVGDGSHPSPLLAWERAAIDPSWVTIEEIDADATKSLYDIESSRLAYRVSLNDANGEQYFILEGKSATTSGWYVPGTGMLVTHIHEGIIDSYSDSNAINCGSSRVHGLNIVEAGTSKEPGKLWTSAGYYGSSLDTFSAETNASLTPSTSPCSCYYTGTKVSTKTGNSGVSITGIGSADSLPMSFTVDVP